MPIEFQCNICGTKLRTPDGTAGKKTKCPKCEYVLAIPETADTSQTPPLPQDTSLPHNSLPSSDVPSSQIPPSQIPPQSQLSLQKTAQNTPSNSEPYGVGDGADSQNWSGFETYDLQNFNSHNFDESGNPYQAPLDDDGMVPLRPHRAAGVFGDRLDFGQAFTMTFDALKRNFLPFFILGCISIAYYMCVLAVQLVLTLLGERALAEIVSQSSNVTSNLLQIGLALCALEVIRTGGTSFATGFSILMQFLSLLGFGILLVLLFLVVVGGPFLLLFLLGYLLSGGWEGTPVIIAVVLGVIWVVVTSIIISCRLGIGGMLIVDQKVSPIEAFRLSWAVTKGNALTIFCIGFVANVCAFLGTCITLGLGAFVIIPFTLCLSAMCYHIMWEQYRARTAREHASEW
jgi:hypothetical protein